MKHFVLLLLSILAGEAISAKNCESQNECLKSETCIDKRCEDPCAEDICGVNAKCEVVNHSPTCSCSEGYGGDPFIRCIMISLPSLDLELTTEVELELATDPTPSEPMLVTQPGFSNACNPTPCGSYSICRVKEEKPDCSCIPSAEGTPPNCKLQCLTNKDCEDNKACFDNNCIDPCQDICSKNSKCTVKKHRPNCICNEGYAGDAYIECKEIPESDKINSTSLRKTCDSCGKHALCKEVEDKVECSCFPSFKGDPPNCQKECLLNVECPDDEACFNNQCKSPCDSNACGIKARCNVVKHIPNCSCGEGFTGDAFIMCKQIDTESSSQKIEIYV